MPVRWTGVEITQMAVQIEKNGEAFYNSLAEATTDKAMKEAFTYLAGEEKKHIAVFEKLTGALDKEQLKAMYGAKLVDEAEGYLKALADSRVFAHDADILQWAKEGKTRDEVLLTAIILEKDSILFYQEMRNYVREQDRKVVDDIIKEEKAHVRKLAELKSA
jgi:rubrerythrin